MNIYNDIIKIQHISLEQIIISLLSRELIDKGKKQLIDISIRTRIYFGVYHPISYQMIESLTTSEGLDYYLEQPKYLINKTETIENIY